jgi:Spy/CpxP family protein refolding chaperone
MKFKTKLFATLALSAALATSLSAQMQERGMGQGAKKGMACEAKSGYGMKGYSQKGGCGVMPLLHKLNLSDEQKEKIQSIMQETMKKKESKYSAFGVDEFDKKKFIEQRMNEKEERIKLQASMLEKVYGVLSAKQKSQLRVLMDLKEERMKQGCNFDKNCNGRR